MPLVTNTTPMSESGGTSEDDAGRRRSGAAFALSAAALAALLLFLPVMILGCTMSVAVSVMRGEGLAWQSGVAMSYALRRWPGSGAPCSTTG